MKIYINDLVKGHSDVKVKCLTFGLYTQVSDSGPLGPLVLTVIFLHKRQNLSTLLALLGQWFTLTQLTFYDPKYLGHGL